MSRKIEQIPITKIRPFGGSYGKGYFHIRAEKVEELAESIATAGILEPLIVRKDPGQDGRYELISGHTRFTAAQKIGLDHVPCLIYDLSDEQALCLYGEANRYRQDITITERAFMLRYAQDYALAQEAEKNAKRNCSSETQIFEGDLQKNAKRHCSAEMQISDGDEQKSAKRNCSSEMQIFDEASEGKERWERLLRRITYLIEPLRCMVDARKISIRAGAACSYLPEGVQDMIAFVLDGTRLVLTEEAVEEIRVKMEAGRPYGNTVTRGDVTQIICDSQPQKEEMRQISIPRILMKKLPPEYQSRKECEALVEKLLRQFCEG